MMAPFGRERAEQSGEPALFLIRLGERAHDVAVDPRRGLRQAFAERFARHRHAVEMQERLEFAQHGADAAGGEQIRHVMRAGRLEIDQDRRFVGQRVKAFERHLDAGAARRWR